MTEQEIFRAKAKDGYTVLIRDTERKSNKEI